MQKDEVLDVEELYALARDISTSGRNRLAGHVGDLFFTRGDKLNEYERELATDILCRLVFDIENEVRASLAEKLADLPHAPKQLINMLANDEIEIARPVLERSRLLTDPELIEVIQLRTMQHRLAIATRQDLGESVVDALISANEPTVLERLLNNKGSYLSEKAMAYLVEESKRVEAYREPLLQREELSAELAIRMYRWVSAVLRRYILQNFDIEPRLLDESMGKTVEQLMEEIKNRAQQGNRPVELAELLEHANATSPDFFVELLRDGQIPLFEGLFAETTGLSMETAQTFIYQPGGEAFAIACKGAHLPKPQFASLFVLSRKARPGDNTVDSNEVPRALSVFDRVQTAVAEAILERWRVDPDYLSLLSHFPIEQFDSLEKPEAVESG